MWKKIRQAFFFQLFNVISKYISSSWVYIFINYLWGFSVPVYVCETFLYLCMYVTLFFTCLCMRHFSLPMYVCDTFLYLCMYVCCMWDFSLPVYVCEAFHSNRPIAVSHDSKTNINNTFMSTILVVICHLTFQTCIQFTVYVHPWTIGYQ